MGNKKIVLIGITLIVVLLLILFWQPVFGVFWNIGWNKGCSLTDTEAIYLADDTGVVKAFTEKYSPYRVINAGISEREDEHGREIWYEAKKDNVTVNLVVFVSYLDTLNNKCEKRAKFFDFRYDGKITASGFANSDEEGIIEAILNNSAIANQTASGDNKTN